MPIEEHMPNGTRKQKNDAQLRAAIMQEAEEPRQAASVKKALEKTPAPPVREKLGGSTGWKAKTAKRREMKRANLTTPPVQADSTTTFGFSNIGKISI
jgi:hypothetical protein